MAAHLQIVPDPEADVAEGEELQPADHSDDGLRPPSRALLALETRAIFELGWFVQSLPLLSLTPRGDGHPVLVLPGFTAGDLSTAPLRRFLESRGFHAHGWKQGRNLGMRTGLDLRMARRLRGIYWRFGCKVSLVGWSLGGIYARELARQHPDQVRQVITLGSPFNLSARANHAWRLYELLSGESVDDEQELLERLREPLPVPTTAVYSRTDGVVAWQTCVDDESRPHTENIEVPGSHCGLGFNPLVAFVLLDRLSQPEGFWRPFDRRGFRRLFYRRPPSSPSQALESED
jgi:pimeloyl-ACP methyl ester carboxylesterase